MVLFSCGKEEATEPTFVEKEFFIDNPETATARVLDFLSYTDLTETTLRSDYPDTEVNEGLWTLEAAGNYVDNVNLSYKSDVTINYNLSVENVNDNGVLKMSGADMTDRFNELQASIAAEEQTNGRVAKIVDFKLESVSNQQSELVVGVVYAGPGNGDSPENIDGCEEWPESENIWTAHIPLTACLLANVDNFIWFQTVQISNISQIESCYNEFTRGNFVYEVDGTTVEPDEFDEAYDYTLTMVNCIASDLYGNAPNSSHVNGPVMLFDINLNGDFFSSAWSAFFCTEVVLGRGTAY